MKTLLIGFTILFLCDGCKYIKDDRQLEGTTSEETNSLLADSLRADSTEIRVPTQHFDQTFDDFVYAYMHDERIQLARTHFPLPLINDSTQTFILREEWIYDPLYSQAEYYHLLFDKEEDMDLTRISSDSVYVAWLYLDKHLSRHYNFERKNQCWLLKSISELSMKGNPNEEFLDFFYRFCNDSVYQREHIQPSLKFITSDPEDDFRVIEALIDIDQWFVFRPVLPTDRMTNINYGQRYSPMSQTKIVAFRSIDSGFNNTLFFNRFGYSWRLSAFEDLSN